MQKERCLERNSMTCRTLTFAMAFSVLMPNIGMGQSPTDRPHSSADASPSAVNRDAPNENKPAPEPTIGPPKGPPELSLDSSQTEAEALDNRIKTLVKQHVSQEVEQLRQQHAQELQKLREQMNRRVEELESTLSEQTIEETETTFSIYGFFDVNFSKFFFPEHLPLKQVTSENPKFLFGNLNMYFDFTPLEHWRMLAEVRFLVNPMGDATSFESPLLGTKFQRIHDSSNDLVNFGEKIRLGSISIERATVQWNQIDWLKLSAGLFLTPYGIWNIDHGSPTRLMAAAPFLYVFEMFPTYQLGLLLEGDLPVKGLHLGYVLTLSNGRSPVDKKGDLDADKALGGRIMLSGADTISWQLGVSWYWGHYTDQKEIGIAIPQIDFQKIPIEKYRETALGADLNLAWGSLGIQWELLANWRNYDDALRPPSLTYPIDVFMGSGLPSEADALLGGHRAADRLTWGMSTTFSYELPFNAVRLRPYVNIVWMDFNDNIIYDNLFGMVFGLNWRIGGKVVLKPEFAFGHWPNKAPQPMLMYGSDNMYRINMQLAIAF